MRDRICAALATMPPKKAEAKGGKDTGPDPKACAAVFEKAFKAQCAAHEISPLSLDYGDGSENAVNETEVLLRKALSVNENHVHSLMVLGYVLLKRQNKPEEAEAMICHC